MIYILGGLGSSGVDGGLEGLMEEKDPDTEAPMAGLCWVCGIVGGGESEVPDLGESMDKGPEAGGSSGRNSVCLESNVKRNKAVGEGRGQICSLLLDKSRVLALFCEKWMIEDLKRRGDKSSCDIYIIK